MASCNDHESLNISAYRFWRYKPPLDGGSSPIHGEFDALNEDSAIRRKKDNPSHEKQWLRQSRRLWLDAPLVPRLLIDREHRDIAFKRTKMSSRH
jgi:hypothetical protein